MRKYTFLTSTSFRTDPVKARNVREAARLTKERYDKLPASAKKGRGSIYYHIYQIPDRNYPGMLQWQTSSDKKLKRSK
jgi:hypothetical protein